MIDLETFGTVPGSIFFSVGAVFFSPSTGQMGEEFYCLVNPGSAMEYGLTSDPDTMKWWDKQSVDARKEIDRAFVDGLKLPDALTKFSEFLQIGSRNNGGMKDLKPISCGADFDIPILTVAYKNANVKLPWKFWNIRCFRTLKAMVPNVEPVREGIFHNALDDSIHQAKWCHNVMKGLGKAKC